MPAVWTPGMVWMRWRISRSTAPRLAAFAVVEVEPDGGGAGRFEAEVDVEDAEEAAQEQTGADEQDAGEGDLRDDEGARRRAVRWPPVVLAAESLSASCRLPLEMRSPGTMPKRIRR